MGAAGADCPGASFRILLLVPDLRVAAARQHHQRVFDRRNQGIAECLGLLRDQELTEREAIPPASRREVVMSRIFGAVCQNGYVVRDIRAAMDHWVNVMGVGPWYYIDQVKTDYFRHRGHDSAVEMSIALANSGDLQIELIQQRNDAPSMYKEFLDSGREGLQHMSYWTQRLSGASTTARWRSATKSGMKARSAAKRAASPISIRRPIPAPLSKSPTSAAARELLRAHPQGRRRLGRRRSDPRSRRTLSAARPAFVT